MTEDKKEDIRWHQRFANFNKAMILLRKAVELSNQRDLTELEEQGLIQAFEFTHDLAWKVMKNYFEYQGSSEAVLTGSRDATREAYKYGLIEDGENWMEMIKSRNETSHTYNESAANDIGRRIRKVYFPLFQAFQVKMESLRSGDQLDIFNETE